MARRTSTTTTPVSAPEPTAPADAPPEATPAPQPATESNTTEPSEAPVVLVGRLTRDPQLRHTPAGTPVCNIRIAINHSDAETVFRTCVCWRRTAEVVSQYMRKGRLVEVTGFERSRTWTDRDGQERVEVEVNAIRVQFIRQGAPQAA